MAWDLLGNLEILLLGDLYPRKAIGKVLIGTPFSHSQKLHYCLIHLVYFHDQTDLVIINANPTTVRFNHSTEHSN